MFSLHSSPLLSEAAGDASSPCLKLGSPSLPGMGDGAVPAHPLPQAAILLRPPGSKEC